MRHVSQVTYTLPVVTPYGNGESADPLLKLPNKPKHTLRAHRNLKKEAECGGGIGVRTAKTFLGNVLLRVSH